jgi:hypothetical protein
MVVVFRRTHEKMRSHQEISFTLVYLICLLIGCGFKYRKDIAVGFYAFFGIMLLVQLFVCGVAKHIIGLASILRNTVPSQRVVLVRLAL